MFQDIKVSLNNEEIKCDYKIVNNEIVFQTNDKVEKQNLKIVYDENIYQIILNSNIKYQDLSKGVMLIDLKNNAGNFNFKVMINYKFFIKTVHKFINNFIDKDTLIKELKLFVEMDIEKTYKHELEKIIYDITQTEKSEEITNILLENEVYLKLCSKMSEQDLMLLITSYIFSSSKPMLSQQQFNSLVKCAINYDHALEKVWRLGLNYDKKNYNYDLLNNFFVKSKDVWYLVEYIAIINESDKEKVINMILNENDKEFIKKLLSDDYIDKALTKEQMKLLQDAITSK